MFSRARRFCPSISDEAKSIYPTIKGYGRIDGLGNKLTRDFARRIVNQTWRDTRRELDFSYTIEDCEVGGIAGSHIHAGPYDDKGPVIFYLHAGAFVCGSPEINAGAVLPACKLARCDAWAVDYALAPEHPFPQGLEDVEAFYRAFCETIAVGRPIIAMGDSAGANMLLASMMIWREKGLRLPDRCVLVSGCLDGTVSSDTIITMQHYDPLVRVEGPNSLKSVFRYYANGHDLSDWRISPIYGDLTGLPPMMIVAGSRETLLGDSARLSERARTAGVDVCLRVLDGMFHMFHLHWSMPEVRTLHQDIARTIRDA